MLALMRSKNHIREFLQPFQWTPSPTSTVNYSWTMLADFITNAKKAKTVLDIIL